MKTAEDESREARERLDRAVAALREVVEVEFPRVRRELLGVESRPGVPRAEAR